MICVSGAPLEKFQAHKARMGRVFNWVRVLLRRVEHRPDAVFVALGVMSATWMAVVAVVLVAQKLARPIRAVDVPLALAIVGLGILIVLAPSSVPLLTPPT
jgi:hypothetical protein